MRRIQSVCAYAMSAALLLAGCSVHSRKDSESPRSYTNPSYKTSSRASRMVEVATPIQHGDTMWRFGREIYGEGRKWAGLLHRKGYDSVAEEIEPGRAIYLGKFPRNSLNRTALFMHRPVLRALDRESNPNADLVAGQFIILPLTIEQAEDYNARHPERRLIELKNLMSISTAF